MSRNPIVVGEPTSPLVRQGKRPPNNFAAVRMFGALWVLADHAIILTGAEAHLPRVFGTGVLGIVVFFSIGGYLVADAWIRRPQFGAYLANRAVRIFPALILVVLVTVFVLGPIVTTLAVPDYFGNPDAWQYLLNIVLRPVFDLPGVFEDNVYPRSVNGSLWTLLPTFAAYLVLPFLLLRAGAWRYIALITFGIGSAFLALALPMLESPLVIYGSLVSSDARMWVYFAVGALIRVALKPEFIRMDVAFALLVVHILLVELVPSISQYALWIVVPYLLVAFGRQSTPVLRRFDRFGDLSYGIFLWAFPIQQLLVAYADVAFLQSNLVLNAVVVAVLSAIAALASIHIIERPALRWRKHLAGRRLFGRGPAPRPAPVGEAQPALTPAEG